MLVLEGELLVDQPGEVRAEDPGDELQQRRPARAIPAEHEVQRRAEGELGAGRDTAVLVDLELRELHER